MGASRSAALQALGRGWRDVGRPLAHLAIKSYFAQRLDLTLAISLNAIAPGGLGLALSRGLRLVVAARVARSQGRWQAAEDSEEDGDDEEERGSDGGSSSRGADRCSNRAAGAGAATSSSGGSSSGRTTTSSSSAPGARRQRPLPKGLGSMPPLPLPRVPPAGLASCSVQPLGLPMMLVSQSAARAPLYAAVRGDRLWRGVLGLAASFLICRAVRTPYTGRLARLPPRFVEALFSSLVGPAAAVSYLSTSAAGQAAGRGDAALIRQCNPELQQLYTRLRSAGQAGARRGGRAVAFAGGGATAEAIPRSDINACCLPGGIVFVNSGLVKAVQGKTPSLAFVLGHEVGHAIGRHSLEKVTSMYTSMFGLDILMGLAERLLMELAPGEENEEWVAGRLKTVDGLLQSGMYLLQLRQSRHHEYEADQLSLALGAGAGMDRGSVHSGARDVLNKFMKMEAAGGPGGISFPAGAPPQGDSPLSTHPVAVNRLHRLTEKVRVQA